MIASGALAETTTSKMKAKSNQGHGAWRGKPKPTIQIKFAVFLGGRTSPWKL
jgi:hypothetical protein